MSNMDTQSSEESTFRSYTPAMAKSYATHRGSYHENLFNVILDKHRSTGGAMKVLLDVGCGPGNSTRPLAKHFDNAFGLDPSPEMINTAKKLSAESPEETASGKSIVFGVGRAEDMNGEFRQPELGVDLLTSATAAHWFDMPQFWSSAAACLKPGGTVAIWAVTAAYLHPSTPNAVNLQEMMSRLRHDNIASYELPGNKLANNSYDHLLLPWNCSPPIRGFLESGYTRLEWDRDGKLSDSEHFFLGDQTVTLEDVKSRFGTASMVTRWREKHPQLVGTEQDIVAKLVREMREILQGDEWVIGQSCVLLLFKRT